MEYGLHNIVQDNFAVVLLILFLQIFLIRNNGFEAKIRRLFTESNIIIFSLVIIDAWELVEATKAAPTQTRLILSIVGYILRPIVAFLVVLAAWNTESKIKKALFSIPLMINFLCMLTALYSPIAFYFTEDNRFMRGPLNFVPYATALFYLFAVIVVSAKIRKEGRMGEAHVVVMIVFIAIASAFAEAIWRFHSFLTASCVVGIAFYYLYFHVAINETDKLTSALNRRRFYLDAKRKWGQVSAVISIDLNDLKKWNDEYGHSEGDRALRTLAETCRNAKGKFWNFYRTGGDEFQLLCFRAEEKEVRSFVETVQNKLAKTNYSAAIGYAMVEKDMDLSRTCLIADERMYENKKFMKGEE